MNKNKNRESQTEVKKGEDYMEHIGKLFGIANPGLEDILQKDRLLDKDDKCTKYRADEVYTRNTEDIAFLLDQRGERKMVMGVKDVSYECRKDMCIKKKIGTKKDEAYVSTEPSVITQDVDKETVMAENSEDEELTVKEKSKKKLDTVTLQLPRDIMNSPEVCSMLDRTGTTTRKAVRNVSSILKAGTVDGEATYLSLFTISRSSLERKRNYNMTV